MDRREFLVGCGVAAASAALPAGPVAKATAVESIDLYFPVWVEQVSQRVMSTILYSNEDYTPMQFNGFIPRYDNAP